MKQDPHMDIGTSMYGCGQCNKLLDEVFPYPDNNQSWFACPHCGWSDHPDDYEPDGFYENRYLSER